MNGSADNLAHAVHIQVINDLSPALYDLLPNGLFGLLGRNAPKFRQLNTITIDVDITRMGINFYFDLVLFAMFFLIGDCKAFSNGIVEILSRDPFLFRHLFECFDKLDVHLRSILTFETDLHFSYPIENSVAIDSDTTSFPFDCELRIIR